MGKKQTNETPEVGFEQALEQLEQAVRQLEDGQLGLSESLDCYQRGVQHLKQCYRALEAAERKIELLTGVDAEGRPVTQPFDESEMSLEEKAASRSRRRSRPGGTPAAAEAGAGDEDDDGGDMDTTGGLF